MSFFNDNSAPQHFTKQTNTKYKSMPLIDAKENGTFNNPYQNTLNKYGLENIKIIQQFSGQCGGKANKGILKSESHKRKISESLKR